MTSCVRSIGLAIVFVLTATAAVPRAQPTADGSRIRPDSVNRRYWEYRNAPIVLLGGSVEDNLFQIADVEAHLDLMKSVGGNYVRNTMSSRDEGNAWPFARNAEGKYDLSQLNGAYWERFDNLLRLAHARDIIVQIEVWDRFDFAQEPWKSNPYNPANNVNYTVEQSRLQVDYPRHPGRNDNPFFRTVPELEHNRTVLSFQHAQVDRMLSSSLRLGNILYCMDNETNGSPEWGAYWSRYIRDKARARGVEVHTTEMWDPWDLSDPMHGHTVDHPDLYSFVDVSQNNHQKGQVHWDNLQRQREAVGRQPRPMNNVKVYGADTGKYGTDRDGTERFWRNLIGGTASVRFHRPPSGLGLSASAQAHVRSARMLADRFGFPRAAPDSGSRKLLDRESNEAYLTSENGRHVVYFPDGGAVRVDLRDTPGRFTLRWLDIARSRWTDGGEVNGGAAVLLNVPGQGHWVAMLEAN
jgi:hypothetical protein